MSKGTSRKLNEQIVDEASEWFVTLRFEAIDQATRDGFTSWLRVSPEHVAAYLDIVALWSELPSVDREHHIDVQALIAAARERSNVLPLRDAVQVEPSVAVTEDEPIKAPRRVRLQRVKPLAVAASLAFLSITCGFFAWTRFSNPTYDTRIGEQRSIALPDGSTVQLNSRSRIRVRFTQTQRNIELLDGQALFKVEKDAQRPFIVRSGETEARAVGTQFDVYRKHGETVVTVVEGRVAVRHQRDESTSPRPDTSPGQDRSSAAPGEGAGVMLGAGEQVTVARALSVPTKVNVSATTAWTERRLIFTSSPLSAVVEEFNRYSGTPLVIGADAPDIPITAVFSTTNPKTFIDFVGQQPEFEVRYADGVIHIEAAQSANRGPATN